MNKVEAMLNIFSILLLLNATTFAQAESGLKTGEWKLVSVIRTDSSGEYDKYPVDGQNEHLLDAGDTNEWASYSRQTMFDLWHSHRDTVMKVVSGSPVSRTYYLQMNSAFDTFDPFHSIRYVPGWGSDYKIAEPAAGSAYGAYNESSNIVTDSNRNMKHFEDNSITVNGVTYTVSRHGITGDFRTGCEWLYTFESHCVGRTATNCYGTCHNDRGYQLVITKVYFRGLDPVRPNPSTKPSFTPSHSPSPQPTPSPTPSPTSRPTTSPSSTPTSRPTLSPTTPTPTKRPSRDPTTDRPTKMPTPDPTEDVCTLGTMTAGGIGDSSAELDRKYFKFDDQTAYDDYASAGSQYWHNGLGRTTYVSQTSLWPEGCMNACCANPACQSFGFYKSNCFLYSVATSAGMDNILGHVSRQGPWGINAGGPGYSIAFWEMSRQPSSHVTHVLYKSVTADENPSYDDCANIPGSAPYLKLVMGSVVDYFRPIAGKTYCDMLKSHQFHEWSDDGKSWVIPSYYGTHLGGSAGHYPSDGRHYLSFWGGHGNRGGCCHNSYTGPIDWHQAFSLYYPEQETPTAIPSSLPTKMPTASPSPSPTEIPSPSPTEGPSQSPSRHPSTSPTETPSASPTEHPSFHPTVNPSFAPTNHPSASPTANPSTSPTGNPSASPTEHPSLNPTANPSFAPTSHPSASPTKGPSTSPTRNPSASPTEDPSLSPTANPSLTPTSHPSASPTENPSLYPSVNPSFAPTNAPTYPPFLIHRGGHFWGANIGECGIFKSQAEIEQACNENPQCVGYSMADPAGWGGRRPDAQPDAKGFYPWCLKSSEAKDGCNDIYHDYYQKQDDNEAPGRRNLTGRLLSEASIN